MCDLLTHFYLSSKNFQLPHEVDFGSSDELKQKDLPEFLLLVFPEEEEVPEEKEKNLMLKIGIKELVNLYFCLYLCIKFPNISLYSLPRSQLEYLLSLKLPFLYSTLEQFVQWIKDGMYDFHQLPLVMRKHLEPPDEEALSNIQKSYAGILCINVHLNQVSISLIIVGTPSGLLQEMQTLTGALVHAESDIRKNISVLMQVCDMLL